MMTLLWWADLLWRNWLSPASRQTRPPHYSVITKEWKQDKQQIIMKTSRLL